MKVWAEGRSPFITEHPGDRSTGAGHITATPTLTSAMHSGCFSACLAFVFRSFLHTFFCSFSLFRILLNIPCSSISSCFFFLSLCSLSFLLFGFPSFTLSIYFVYVLLFNFFALFSLFFHPLSHLLILYFILLLNLVSLTLYFFILSSCSLVFLHLRIHSLSFGHFWFL